MGSGKSLRERLRVQPGDKVDLDTFDPCDTHGHDKDKSERELVKGIERLAALQDRLWAEAKHGVLVVLQGIDTAGKDGTIRHVMTAFNPQGCYAVPFKVPSVEEAAHDYLWRIHAHTPGAGEIAIFNRSHYESVLVVRVHSLVPEAIWSRRYEEINEWERLLVDEGTSIVKFFLFIDRDEQRERFQARLDDPTKRWKFSMGDLEERKLWDQYRAAFEEMLSRCSTDRAPWYLIPSNRKWFRNLAVADILADVIDELNPQYPAEPDLPKDLVIE